MASVKKKINAVKGKEINKKNEKITSKKMSLDEELEMYKAMFNKDEANEIFREFGFDGMFNYDNDNFNAQKCLEVDQKELETPISIGIVRKDSKIDKDENSGLDNIEESNKEEKENYEDSSYRENKEEEDEGEEYEEYEEYEELDEDNEDDKKINCNDEKKNEDNKEEDKLSLNNKEENFIVDPAIVIAIKNYIEKMKEIEASNLKIKEQKISKEIINYSCKIMNNNLEMFSKFSAIFNQKNSDIEKKAIEKICVIKKYAREVLNKLSDVTVHECVDDFYNQVLISFPDSVTNSQNKLMLIFIANILIEALLVSLGLTSMDGKNENGIVSVTNLVVENSSIIPCFSAFVSLLKIKKAQYFFTDILYKLCLYKIADKLFINYLKYKTIDYSKIQAYALILSYMCGFSIENITPLVEIIQMALIYAIVEGYVVDKDLVNVNNLMLNTVLKLATTIMRISSTKIVQNNKQILELLRTVKSICKYALVDECDNYDYESGAKKADEEYKKKAKETVEDFLYICNMSEEQNRLVLKKFEENSYKTNENTEEINLIGNKKYMRIVNRLDNRAKIIKIEILIEILNDVTSGSYKNISEENPLVHSSSVIVSEAKKNALKTTTSTSLLATLQTPIEFNLSDILKEMISYYINLNETKIISIEDITKNNDNKKQLRKINEKMKLLAIKYCTENNYPNRFDIDPEVNIVYCYGPKLLDDETIKKQNTKASATEILYNHPILLQQQYLTRIIRIIYELYANSPVFDISAIILLKTIIQTHLKSQLTGVSSLKKITAIESWIGELLVNTINDYTKQEVLTDKTGRYIGNIARLTAFILGNTMIHFSSSVKSDPLIIFLKKINFSLLVQNRTNKAMKKVVTFYDMFLLTLVSGMPSLMITKYDDKMLEFQKDSKQRSLLYHSICETFGGWLIKPKGSAGEQFILKNENEIEYISKMKDSLLQILDDIRMAIKQRNTQVLKIITILDLRDQFCLDSILYAIDNIN